MDVLMPLASLICRLACATARRRLPPQPSAAGSRVFFHGEKKVS